MKFVRRAAPPDGVPACVGGLPDLVQNQVQGYGLGVREIPLLGGDMNTVVRVGDTVRRPPQPPGVRALLQWYERTGFDGAPRYLGVDAQGREILSFVEGEPAFAPVPATDDVVAAIGRLLRAAHDAQAGFVPPERPGWLQPADPNGEIVAHHDLFWTNVIMRDGLPAALIDWELAAPATRTLEVALAATYWAGIRIDTQLHEWGLPRTVAASGCASSATPTASTRPSAPGCWTS